MQNSKNYKKKIAPETEKITPALRTNRNMDTSA